MIILAINAGSSSLKFQIIEMPNEEVIASGVVERIGLLNSILKINSHQKIKITRNISTHEQAISQVFELLLSHKIIDSLDDICGVGHRVVHGGEYFNSSVIIDDEVIEKLEALYPLAPLHNPANVTGIKAFKKILPNAKAVAVFDTAFHQTMKSEAYLYATPYQWYTEHKVRKYGFHGTSHQYVSERVYQLLGDQNKKIIVAHLGNGASLCAIKNGLSIDTTMGFTPLAGIPMGTRSGDIDPAIISFIMNKEGWNAKRVIDELNSNSGFLAISGFSSDARDVLFKASQGNKRAILTLDIYGRRIAGVIGEYHVLLGGLDAIAFTAGIGENAVEIREKIMNNLSALGVILDESANQVRGEERLISTDDSKVKVYLVPTNEEVVIARDTYTYCLN